MVGGWLRNDVVQASVRPENKLDCIQRERKEEIKAGKPAAINKCTCRKPKLVWERERERERMALIP